MPRPTVYDVHAYRSNPELAVPLLAEFLRNGSLIIALGSGASKGLGLPEWHTLVERCLKETNRRKGTNLEERVPINAENKALCQLIDGVEKAYGPLDIGKSEEYRTLVHDCLYEGVVYDASVLRKDLLIALGALIMGSKRGSVKEVFNFNFDDVLDWYLRLHGFDTHIVVSLPSLQRAPDVTIYHPHGYLPFSMTLTNSSDFLIFSQNSYDTILGEPWEPWRDLFKTTMMRGVLLFVGLSGEDQIFGPALTWVKKLIGQERFTGFWMFGPDAEEMIINNLSDRNVVPLCFDNFDKYAEFLLSICREALNF